MKFELLVFLFLVFSGLKLGGVIDWSWWWVTCPLWIVPLMGLIFVVFIVCLWIFSDSFDVSVKNEEDK